MNTSVSYVDFGSFTHQILYTISCKSGRIHENDWLWKKNSLFLGLILTSSRLLSVFSLPKPCPVTIQKSAKRRIYKSYRSQCSALRNRRDHAQTVSCAIWASFKASYLAFAHTHFTSFPFLLSLLRAEMEVNNLNVIFSHFWKWVLGSNGIPQTSGDLLG